MSILNQERGHVFEYYVDALRGQFGNNLPQLIHESNKEVFRMRKKPNDNFMPVSLNKIQVGKFYLINYEFNGNKLFCPIFVIDYRITDKNNPVIYAINLDYLPFEYKKIYFNKMYNMVSQTFEYNSDAKNFMTEKPIKVNFEMIYNSLKSNGGFNFAISAFNLSKVNECYGVSTDLMYVMIHVHMRTINIALMKELSLRYENGSEEEEKLNKLISDLEQLIESYDTDVLSYYKKLRNIETNYKMFE